MDRNELARAYRNIGVAYIAAAEVLEGATAVPAKDATVGELAHADYVRRTEGLQPLPPLNVPIDARPTDNASYAQPEPLRCPAHGTPYRSGTRGLFCTAKGIEPAWTDRKGYCSITPDNAAQYVAIHTAR